MATDFQKYQAGRSLLADIDSLLDVDKNGYSRKLDTNVADAKVLLGLALEELLKRVEEKSSPTR